MIYIFPLGKPYIYKKGDVPQHISPDNETNPPPQKVVHSLDYNTPEEVPSMRIGSIDDEVSRSILRIKVL